MNFRFRRAGARSGGWLRASTLITLIACAGLSTWCVSQSCPIESNAIENAKPNKLYLYFPAADDAAFPATTCTLGANNHCAADHISTALDRRNWQRHKRVLVRRGSMGSSPGSGHWRRGLGRFCPGMGWKLRSVSGLSMQRCSERREFDSAAMGVFDWRHRRS